MSGPDVFLETGKVVGQNSTRMAGQVIVGVSAAFLVWDVVDLGWTVSDLIRYVISVHQLLMRRLVNLNNNSDHPSQEKGLECRQDPKRKGRRTRGCAQRHHGKVLRRNDARLKAHCIGVHIH